MIIRFRDPKLTEKRVDHRTYKGDNSARTKYSGILQATLNILFDIMLVNDERVV